MSIQVKGFVNANIYAEFKPIKKADSMVVVGNRILYIGKQETVEFLTKKIKRGNYRFKRENDHPWLYRFSYSFGFIGYFFKFLGFKRNEIYR